VWPELHLQKIEAMGSVERRQGSGTKCTVSTRENIESVHELVLSQESQPGTHWSVHKIARETDDNRSHRVSVFKTQRWKL